MLELQAENLEILFDYFNEKLFDEFFNTRPVITIQSAGKKNALGWCTIGKLWVEDNGSEFHEINISAEHLGSGIEAVSSTLLHEMCHLYNLINDGKSDTNPSNQYHSLRFKDTAESIGFIVEKMGRRGYARTILSDNLKDLIKSSDIKDTFTIRRLQVTTDSPKRKRKPTKGAEIVPGMTAVNSYVLKCPTCNNMIVSCTKEGIYCTSCSEAYVLK